MAAAPQDKGKSIAWVSIVATLATTVLAISSLITVYVTVTAWREEREAARPYLTVQESPRVTVGERVSFELKFTNSGLHPAANLSSKSLVFAQDLAHEPVHHDEFDLANEIPNNTVSSLVIDLDRREHATAAAPPVYIVVDLQYDDPILNKGFNQTIYLKWNGVTKGETQPIAHVQVTEKNKILNYFKNQHIDPSARQTI